MAGRLSGKIAIVVGAGQMPGETIGNGRAIALTWLIYFSSFISGVVFLKAKLPITAATGSPPNCP